MRTENWKRMVVASLAAMLVSTIVPTTITAQIISGELVGTIMDTTGARVSGATVEALDTNTGVSYLSKTNEVGEYRFSNLPVGTYTVSASHVAGFATTVIRDFILDLNKTSTLPIILRPSRTETDVVVTVTPPNLDTTSSQITSTFAEKQTEDLPTSSVGYGVLNLSLLTAGVASSGGVGVGAGPSVGGQRPRNNNFTIEGVDNNDKHSTGPLVSVPNDAVAEFSLLQNQFSPDFGHSSGGQFNTIVKSGTNSYHGRAYIYNQNRTYNAIDTQTALSGFTANQRFDSNRIGAQLGGPILKNRLFFFANYDYQPVGQASIPGTICAPTASGFSTLNSLSGISATNLAVFQKYVPPARAQDCASVAGSTVTVLNTSIPVGTLSIAAPNYENGKALTTSVDYNISSKDYLRSRYIYNSVVGIDTAATLPVFYLSVPNKLHLVAINEYHTFTPTLQNEFRLGFNRFANNVSAGNFPFPGLDKFPNIAIDDLTSINIGPDPNSPQETIQNTYQIADALSWVRGSHSLKFGIEGRKFIAPSNSFPGSRGEYEYSSLDRYLQDLNPDVASTRTTGNTTYYGDQSALYWFVNDNWRLRPSLSLNVGVRYEYTTVPASVRLQSLNLAASVPGLISFAEPRAPKNDWGPRIGFAYSPGGKGLTAIRGGFGIAYDVIYDNIGTASIPPQIGLTENGSLTGNIPNFLSGGGLPPGSGGFITFPSIADQRAATTHHSVVNQRSPMSIDWTLGIQRNLWKDYTVEARYLGTRGLHLNVQELINLAPLVTPALYLPTFVTAPSQAALDASTVSLGTILNSSDGVVPAFDAAGFNQNVLTQHSPVGSSTYHGLAIQVSRRFSGVVQFAGAYTYSHLIDDSTADFHSTDLTPRRPENFQNLANDRSNSALDHRHRLTLALIYNEPYFRDRNWFVKNALGNWQVAPIYTYQSPEWVTVQSGRDVNLNGDAAGDRVILNPKGIPGTGTDVIPLCRSAVPAADCTQHTMFNDASNPFTDPNTGISYDVTDNVVGYKAQQSNAQYIRGDYGALTNVGRNTLPLKPINNIDLAAVKRFSLTERFAVEFQAQAFNLLNHPQYVAGSLNQVTPILTTGTVRADVLPFSADFNHPEALFPSNARSLQLTLKVLF